MTTSDSSDPAHNFYIETLKRKYLAARNDVDAAVELLNGARHRLEVYGETLKAEGLDLAVYDNAPRPETPELWPSTSDSGRNGHSEKPINATHAMHLLMKRHGNVGFTLREIKRLSDDAKYGLIEKTIRNTWWRQLGKGLMERVPGGGQLKIRLTKEGEQFDRFRIAKAG